MNVADHVIRVNRVLDTSAYLEIDKAIVERVYDASPVILLDMSSLKKLSPKAVSPLLRRAKWTQAYGSELRLAGARPSIRNILEQRDMDGMLKLYATPMEALNARV